MWIHSRFRALPYRRRGGPLAAGGAFADVRGGDAVSRRSCDADEWIRLFLYYCILLLPATMASRRQNPPRQALAARTGSLPAQFDSVDALVC